MNARSRIIAVLTVLATSLAVAVLAGCGSLSGGDKGVVEQAFLDFGTKTKSARFVGTVSMTDPAKGEDTVAMRFDMAMDASDPAKPAFSMKMSGVEDTGEIEMVVIGTDFYVTSGGQSQKIDISDQTEQMMKSFTFKDQLNMLKAISDSVSGFKQGGAEQVDGVKVNVYNGELDVAKLIDGLLPQLEKMMPSGKAGGFSLEGGSEMISGMIKSMVKEPVQLWFGIDDQGVLRLIAFEMKMSAPFATEGQAPESMAIKARFEARDVNEPVEIEAPANAKPGGDLSDFQNLMQ